MQNKLSESVHCYIEVMKTNQYAGVSYIETIDQAMRDAGRDPGEDSDWRFYGIDGLLGRAKLVQLAADREVRRCIEIIKSNNTVSAKYIEAIDQAMRDAGYDPAEDSDWRLYDIDGLLGREALIQIAADREVGRCIEIMQSNNTVGTKYIETIDQAMRDAGRDPGEDSDWRFYGIDGLLGRAKLVQLAADREVRRCIEIIKSNNTVSAKYIEAIDQAMRDAGYDPAEDSDWRLYDIDGLLGREALIQIAADREVGRCIEIMQSNNTVGTKYIETIDQAMRDAGHDPAEDSSWMKYGIDGLQGRAGLIGGVLEREMKASGIFSILPPELGNY